MMSVVFRIVISIVAFNLICICEPAEYQPNVYAMVEKREELKEVKACGPLLADILALTCNNKYFYKGKRADHTSDNVQDSDYYYNYEAYPAEVLAGYPFRSKRSVASILRSTKRAHGLTDECCRKSCTMDELRSYCGA